MSELIRIGDLDIDEDIEFQRRMWAFQRAGWVLMGLLVVAALLGALGGRGPLAGGEIGDDATGLRLEYRRLTRHGSPDRLVVHLAAGTAASDSTLSVWLDRSYLEGLEIRTVTPEPVEVRAADDRITYRFKLSDPARAATVTFLVEPIRSFARSGAIGSDRSPTHRFSQFVFP